MIPPSAGTSIQHVFNDSFVLVASAAMSALRNTLSPGAEVEVDVGQSSFMVRDGDRRIQVECKMISSAMTRVRACATEALINDSKTAAAFMVQTSRLLGETLPEFQGAAR